MKLNMDQITGIIRVIIPTFCAFAAGKGWIPSQSIADITAAVVAIAAAVWSVQNNKTGKTIQ